jgi:two-component sensor histidine kinase
MRSQDDTIAPGLRRQQWALAEFGLHAFRSDDLGCILRRACELVAGGLGVKFAKVLQLLPDGQGLLVRAGVNWKPGVVGVVVLGADSASPAGYALRTDGPVYSPDVAAETRFRIPAVLIEHDVRSMVNVIIAGEGGPFGVLEVDATRTHPFDEDDIAFLENCANLLAAAIDRHDVHKALEQALSEQRLLAQELAHRVKNTLGLVQALTAQAEAEDSAARALRDSLLGMLQALAAAEELLFRDHGQTVDLAELARKTLKPFEGSAGRLEVDGPSVPLPARSGRMLSLVLHELAANATKYGALSAREGVARLFWTAEAQGPEARVRLRWEESDGPAVESSARRGFGTKLLTALTEYELDGSAELNHSLSGLTYQLTFTNRVE